MKHEILMRNKAKGLVVATAESRGKEILVTNSFELLAECLAKDLANIHNDPLGAAFAAEILSKIEEKSILEISLAELL